MRSAPACTITIPDSYANVHAWLAVYSMSVTRTILGRAADGGAMPASGPVTAQSILEDLPQAGQGGVARVEVLNPRRGVPHVARRRLGHRLDVRPVFRAIEK